MTFDAFCAQWNVTPGEREALVWQLINLRARALYAALSKHAPASRAQASAT